MFFWFNYENQDLNHDIIKSNKTYFKIKIIIAIFIFRLYNVDYKCLKKERPKLNKKTLSKVLFSALLLGGIAMNPAELLPNDTVKDSNIVYAAPQVSYK